MSFALRGIVEGFYNRLWSWPVRERFAEAAAGMGFTVYAYAPKEDRFQNAGWRTPYPDIERRRLAEFAARCRRLGMEAWFGLRPVGISYADDGEAGIALDKLRDYVELGAARLVLLADDIPLDIDPRLAGRFADLAEAHAWLIHEIRRQLDGVRLVFCPTEYHGFGGDYLRKLAPHLPPDVELSWTGPRVCSGVISSSDTRAIGEILGRPPLIWDNYPVNDAHMVDELHIGPIRDRDADLDQCASGVLVNPAMEAEASLVPLATWAEYLRDPAGYDPDAAWQRALLSIAGRPADAEAVAALAAHADRSVINQPWRRGGEGPIDPAARRAASVANRQLADDLRRFVERLPPDGG